MDRFSSVPNFFYDFIVFVAPTIGIAAGISLGFTGSFGVIEQWLKDVSVIGAIGITLLLFFVSYEYGRLAETYSDFFVGKVLNFVRGWGIGWLLQDPDYRRDLSVEISQLPLPEVELPDRRDSKWTVYFFASFVNPQIGGDLLKRYAWEKLARSSAFSAFLLLAVSVGVHIFELISKTPLNTSIFQFGGWGYTASALVLYTLLTLDYFKRNCWNNDLLMSVIPVLVANHISNAESGNAEVTGTVSLSKD